MLDIGNAPIHINDLIFNETSSVTAQDPARNVPAVFRVLWYAILTFGPALILWRRYVRIGL